jgi:predicted O-methyltransferase YrrM
MKNHWEQGLCIKKLLLEHKPKHILELGCLEGENTQNLIKLAEEIDFKLTCISDDLEMKEDGVRRIRGVSYKEIPKLEDKSIDFVLLDTDHNYWTLNKELALLYPKLSYGALIVIHDVEYFYYNTGIAVLVVFVSLSFAVMF